MGLSLLGPCQNFHKINIILNFIRIIRDDKTNDLLLHDKINLLKNEAASFSRTIVLMGDSLIMFADPDYNGSDGFCKEGQVI